MDVKLVVQRVGQAAQTVRLRSKEMIVGRQKGCGVRVPSAQVSRQHCILTYKDDLLAVEDLNSANGTLINGRRIVKREYLRPGDKLTVGPVTMLVQYQLSDLAVQGLLQTDQEEFVAVPIDDGRSFTPAGAESEDAHVELLVEQDDLAPLAVDDPLDDLAPTQDPLDALRAIEAKASAEPAPKKTVRKTKPKRAPAPMDDDMETMTTPPPAPRVKVAEVDPPLAPAAAYDEDPASDAPPDASQILGNKNWQLPTGEDIRDILAQIEKGKKKS